MMKLTNLFSVLLAAVCALAAMSQAYARNCGQPPDPRYNTPGYASWCDCMGGTYNYQTTECVGARGATEDDSTTSPERVSPTSPERGAPTPSANWGRYAQASNGASGSSWGWGTEAQARDRALAACRSGSKGELCTIRYCQRGTSASRRPGPTGTQPTAPLPAPPRKQYAY